MRRLIEPYRIKCVEPIRMTTREERRSILSEAGGNVFQVKAEDVLIDLLTDSGTGAMSRAQWSALMNGDESYAGANSWFRFRDAIRNVTGFPEIIPTHQGRASERILFAMCCKEGDVVPNNTHFDTTRANVEAQHAEARDLLIPEGRVPSTRHPFKGNMDIGALRKTIEEVGVDRIPLVMITVTNNSGGGQPVSLENIRAVRAVCDEFDLPLFLDACRFAENAWFIKMREGGQSNRSARDIAKNMFDLADGCTMSAKKDAFANIGGFLAVRDEDLARRVRDHLILTEGFPTYGGLAGRDLEAIAVGIQEILEEDYLRYRIDTTQAFADDITSCGVPIVQPAGGHAVYIDAAEFLPHILPLELPGLALTNELFLEAGVRAVEIGTVMFGKCDPETGEETAGQMELVRLALPRRVYTQAHMEYVAEAIRGVWDRRDDIRGWRITYQAPALRHFTAKFERL
jgi:tyrosine phenol-lyase